MSPMTSKMIRSQPWGSGRREKEYSRPHMFPVMYFYQTTLVSSLWENNDVHPNGHRKLIFIEQLWPQA